MGEMQGKESKIDITLFFQERQQINSLSFWA